MLLITQAGIFEIQKTSADNKDSKLTVRACVRRDLETLRDCYLPTMKAIKVDKSYYRYKARVSRKDLQKAVSLIVSDIDYSHFGLETVPLANPELILQQCMDYHKILEVLKTRRNFFVAVDPLSSMKAPCFGILFNKEGHVLLVEPADHLHGNSWTFPKADKQNDETEINAAIRCLKEESGYASFFVCPFTVSGKNYTKATYCLLKPEGKPDLDSRVSRSVRWATVDEAEKLISHNPNAIGRRRDLAVLKAAAEAFADSRVEWK